MAVETRLTIEEWKQVAEAVKALGLTQKNDPASTTITASPPYAPFPGNEAQFGMFTQAGVRPQRWSTVPTPHSLASILGAGEPSIYWQELLEVMTGVTADSGTNATGWCGNPPTVGQGKVCEQVYKWGKSYVKTDLNALPDVGQFKDRSVLPAEILNPPVDRRNPFVPDLFYQWDGGPRQLQYELWRIGKSLEKSWELVAITGDDTQASASTEHGWITEFDGLDGQIKTGYTDNPTGLACPAMDSIVKSFNAEIDETDANGDNIVQAVTDVVWAAKDRASEFGMPGALHAIVMRKEQFRALTEVWACNYATYRCSGSASLPVNQDANETNRLRLEMMRGQYLLVDNEQVPVVFSEGVTREGVGANHFKADMYVVPVSWEGLRLLRLEYFPMDNAELREFASFVDDDIVTLNNGLFIAGVRSTGLCKEYHFGAKMRLILETPFLAGRIDDVRFTFRADIRNAMPGDTYNYADGGVTKRV
jgi:hypothetical protein